MPKFQCPEGTTSVSVGGEQYNADERGQIDAPDSVATLLEPHGFKRAPEAAAAPAADATPPLTEQTAPEGDQKPAVEADTAPATTKTTKKAAAAPAAE